MIVNITDLILCPTSFPVPVLLAAMEVCARSISVIDQSKAKGSFYSPVFFGPRATGTPIADRTLHFIRKISIQAASTVRPTSKACCGI
jgi:hypothetical protein